MIDDKIKEQIDAKLKLANIDNLTQENSGKIKRLGQLLYNDDKEKKTYMMLEIAKRNSNVAMEIAKNLKDNEELVALIINMAAGQAQSEERSSLEMLINLFHQGKEEEFVKGLLEIADALEDEDRKRIIALLGSYGEVLLFLEKCLVNQVICDDFFAHIIKEFEFNYGDVLANQKRTYSVTGALLEKGCYNACAVLIQRITVYKFYKLYRISYYDFNRIMCNQNVIENTDKLELGYCKVSYAKGFDSYQIYRNKYKFQIEKKAYWFYLSLLYEYLHTGEFQEKHLRYFEELNQYPIGEKLLEHGELFSAVAYAIQSCVKRNEDVAVLLQVLNRVNISRIDYANRVNLQRYDRGVLLPESGMELLKKYQSFGHSLEEMMALYFNTYLKYAVRINDFFRLCISYEHFTAKLEAWLQKTYFKGRIAIKDLQTLMINPYHFKAKNAMVYKLAHKDLNKFEKGDEITFRLTWKEWHVEIEEVKSQADSDGQPEEKVEQALSKMQQMCEQNMTASNVWDYVQELKWNDIYHFSSKNVYYDFAFFGSYTETARDIFVALVERTNSLILVLKLYMNSFLKLALSLNDFYRILQKHHSDEDIEKAFDKYVFCMNQVGKERITYLPVQVKVSSCHMADTEKIRCFHRRCMARFKGMDSRGDLLFSYDEKETYDTIIADGIQAMLRGFRGCLTATRDSAEQYERIKRVPLEYYDNDLELKNQIAELIRKTMERRAHNSYFICNYIKSLSLHNVYCSRLDVDSNWEEISRYQYDESLIPRAENMTKILARNADTLSRCFFVYINSFVKQYLSAEEFMARCLFVNPKLIQDEVEYDVAVLGDVERKEDGTFVFRATSVRCDKAFCLEQTEDNKKVGAVLKLIYKSEKLDWYMVKEK